MHSGGIKLNQKCVCVVYLSICKFASVCLQVFVRMSMSCSYISIVCVTAVTKIIKRGTGPNLNETGKGEC